MEGTKAANPPSPPPLLYLVVCSTCGEFDTGNSVSCDINLHYTGSPLSIGCIGAVRHQLVLYKESARGRVAGFEPITYNIAMARPYYYTKGPLPLVEQFAISINLVSVFHLQYMVLLPRKAVNNTVMHAKIRAMP